MQDAISKAKGQDAALSRSWHQAYRHNTIKARRQDGRREVEAQHLETLEEEAPAPSPAAAQIASPEFRLVVYTQYRENYGAHDWDGKGQCPQYWKSKGGMEFVLPLSLRQVVNLGFMGLSDLAHQMMRHEEVSYRNDYSESWPIAWELLSPGELTEDEKLWVSYPDHWLPRPRLLI